MAPMEACDRGVDERFTQQHMQVWNPAETVAFDCLSFKPV